MGNYDAEIRVSTKVETSQMQRLQLQIDKAVDKVDALTKKYDELKNKKIPTQGYKEVQKQIENTEKKISDLTSRQEKFLATGGKASSSAYKRMEYDLEELRNSLPYLKGELQDLVDTGKAFTLGNSEEINKTANELAKAKSELRMLVTKQDELGAKSVKVSDGLKKIGNASRSAFRVINQGANKAFSSVSRGARQSSGLLSAFANRLRGLAASAFIFNLISKGFNSMVSSMKTGFTNLMGYSDSFAGSIQSVKNSLSTLGNQIAAAFAPIVQAVIPWLNQLVSMITTAMSYVSQFIAALTGRSTYIRAKKVQDSFNSSLGDTSSKADDAADSMDDMADSAKKARGALAEFDDLDVLEKQNDSAADKIKDLDNAIKDLGSGAGGGMGDLFEEVPIEDSILDAVERLMEILARLFAPLKEAWEREGKFVIDAWKFALKEIWQLMKDIGRDFLTMWNQEATIRMLANILHIIGDIGLVIGNIAHALDEAWNKNNTGLHILENIRDVFAVIVQNIREAADYTVEWSRTLNFSPLLESIEHLTSAFVPFADFVSGTLADFYTQFLLPLASWTISDDGLPRLVNILGDFMDAVDWESLRASLKNLYSALEPYAEAIGEGLIDFIEKLKDIGVNILNALPEPIQKLADALSSGDPQTVRAWTTTILEFAVAIEGIKLAFKGFEIVQSGLALFGIGGAATTVAATATEAASGINLLSSAISSLVAVAAGLGIVEALKDPIIDLAEAAGISSDKADYMRERYRGLGGDLNLIKDPVSILTNGFQGLGWEMSNSLGASGALETAMNNIAEGMVYTDDKLSKMQKNFSLTNDDMEMLRQAMLDMHPELLELADGFEGLNGASVESLQQIYTGLQDVANGVSTTNSVAADMADKFGVLTDTASMFFDNMQNGADYVSYYENSIRSASDTTQQFATDMAEAGDNIAAGITEGFEKADVETPVAGFFSRVKESLMSIFDMHSPAKNMEPFGENIFLGVVNGFKGAFSVFTDATTEWWENYVVPWFSAERWQELGENIKLAFIEKWTEIQEWFSEFWTIFTETLFEIWENIILFFTEAWENITLIFQTFIDFINEVVIPIWQTAWTTAQGIFQTFRDFVNNVVNLIKTLFTEFFQKFVKNIIDVNWKNAWENAKNIFEAFKGKVSNVIDVIRDIIQSFFDWVLGIVSEIIGAIESIGSAVAGVFSGGGFGGGSSGGGGGAPFSMARAASYNLEGIPALASGAVIRGGNPYMAILGDQPRGQTNVEAPIDTIKQAVREEMSGMNFGTGNINADMTLDGETVGRLLLPYIIDEMIRQGLDVDILGVT